jgi:hypothetical protein
LLKNPGFYWYFPVDSSVRDAGVAGSNPATPTIISIAQQFQRFKAQRQAVKGSVA